jgi:hypothetical protein
MIYLFSSAICREKNLFSRKIETSMSAQQPIAGSPQPALLEIFPLQSGAAGLNSDGQLFAVMNVTTMNRNIPFSLEVAHEILKEMSLEVGIES